MAVDKTSRRSRRKIENSNNWLNYHVTRNDKFRRFHAIFHRINLERYNIVKKKLTTFTLLATAFLLTACSSDGKTYGNLSQDEAKTEVEAYYKKIDPQTATLTKDISNTSLNQAEELPDIDKSYPYTIDGEADIDVEIFVSSEKGGNGKDGILNEIAEDFNRMSDYTKSWTIMMEELLILAEKINDQASLPVGTRRYTLDDQLYLGRRLGKIEYLVAVRDSTLP